MKPKPPLHLDPPASDILIGLAWLYALHACTSLARNHLWQAEFMISGLRDTTLALDCLLNEIQHADPTLAANLQETLKSLPSNPAMLN